MKENTKERTYGPRGHEIWEERTIDKNRSVFVAKYEGATFLEGVFQRALPLRFACLKPLKCRNSYLALWFHHSGAFHFRGVAEGKRFGVRVFLRYK